MPPIDFLQNSQILWSHTHWRSASYDDAVYSLRVTDKDTLDFLDNQKTITTYKTMQLVDGKLYPPMAARIDGRYEDASELGKWEMAVERPDLVKDGKFKLDKGKGQGSLMAAYNPYMHSSNLVLNDQFSGAYTRDNLVTVECEVPVSEMTSGYHADGAKDSVGWHSWHTGTVAGQVRKATGMERQVFLSRWIKPVCILSNAEVAGMYKELLGNAGIAVPDNVVTPGLLAELKKAGVPIKESGRVKTAAGEGDGVKYSPKTTSDKTVVSIKQQIANVSKTLNDTEPVVQKNVSEIFSEMNIKQKRAWAETEALKYGNRVDRQEYGAIEVSRKDVNSALNYLQSDGENVKPQFSLKAPVEETKNLLALHNLTEKICLTPQSLADCLCRVLPS